MTLQLILIISFAINFVLSILVSQAGSRREIGQRKSFWISYLLSPIIGSILVAISLPINKEKDEIEKKETYDINSDVIIAFLISAMLLAFLLQRLHSTGSIY